MGYYKIKNVVMKTSEVLEKLCYGNYIKNYDDILDNFEQTICIVCGREVKSYWEPQYNGLRARCKNCSINWAES